MLTKNKQFVPHPGKQTEFLQSTADWIFFGGARGGSKSFSLTISNPANRVGFRVANSIDGEPEDYARDRVDVTGSLMAKMDDTTVAQLPFFLAGTSKSILVGDEGTAGGGSASDIFFEIPQAKYTGHNLDLGSEGGVFIELPFQGTATGTQKLVTVKLT